MSSTILRHGGFRFYFFSREETRGHIHVSHADGGARFWLEPSIVLAQNYGLSTLQLRSAEALIRAHEDTIRIAWRARFGR